MNILREVRKSAQKSIEVRIKLILMFSVILIVNTYAWFNIDKELKIKGIENKTIPWDVAYFVNGQEIFDEYVTFTIDELYPGMKEWEQTVNVHNLSVTSSSIGYEVTSVKIFGQDVLEQLKTDGVIQTQENITNIFGDDSLYPFDITYTCDKNFITGEYVDDTTTPESNATFKINASWPYETGSTTEEIITGDATDTQFGKEAYKYYKDGNSPNSAIEITIKITTKMFEVSDIELKNSDVSIKTYGIDGQGVAILSLKEEYKSLGGYLQYVVVAEGDTLDENAIWKQSDKITGLKESDTIYVRMTDGVKQANGIVAINLNSLFEKYTDEYTKDVTEYTDANGDTAYIPEGFKVGNSSTINTIDNGLVIEDKNGNQFVWVPVKDVVYDETTEIPTSESSAKNDTTFYRPMARYQAGSKRYYEGMYYTFVDETSYANLNYRLGQANYSEPRLVTNYGQYTWNIEGVNLPTITRDLYYATSTLGFASGEEFGKYMNEEYTNMINSVKKYGGFYVGRYEASFSNNVAQSKPGQTPSANINWGTMYRNLDSNRYSLNPYYNNSQHVSSMIWNSQWNAMLNWILKGPNAQYVNDKSIGNLSNTVNKTGDTSTDIINNIFDLTGNVAEWTQTGYSSWAKAYRGSGRYSTDGNYREGPASNIFYFESNVAQAFLGTRMTLYIKEQNDTTPPTITFRDTPTSTTNSIKVKVEAQDDSSGIKNYVYSISSDGGKNYKDYTAYGNTYTFENLVQNSNYYVKVKVYDYAGNVNEVSYPNVITTGILEVVTGDIELDALYGKSGSGIAYLEIAKNLADQGYSLEHQIVKSGGTFSENGTWTKGQQINNLSTGDAIYARVTDGTNTANSSSIYTYNVTELETFSEEKKSLTQYTDINGDKAYIPSGFKVGTSSLNNTIDNGLVIESVATGDQFVWIPVEHAIYNSADGTIPTNASNANKNKDSNGNVIPYKPMAKYQKGYSESTQLKYFEGLVYSQWGSGLVKGSYAQRGATSYALGEGSHREPSLITDDTRQYTWKFTAGKEYDANSAYYSKILKFESATKFGEYMNTEYTNMVQSVDKYGGFYVGRYETSYSGTIAKSQYNTTPMASINWYNMYYNQDSIINPNNPYHGNTEVVTSMIWGSQWDAMLNWILEGPDAKQVYTVTGNHSGTRRTTGVSGNDFANNLIDISSNVYEWTQEANAAKYRGFRGGYSYTSAADTASTRNNINPTYTDYNIGSRFTLYVK